MLLKLIQVGIDYVQSNPIIVGAVMAAVEWVKKLLEGQKWLKSWHKVVIAFALSFAFILEEFPPKFTPELIAQGVAVGLVATGVYKLIPK